MTGLRRAVKAAALRLHGSCPVDDTVVWLESARDDYGLLDRVEELHDIVRYAEPEPYGVSTIDD